MRYTFKDQSGEVYAGNTYAQVVQDMRRAAWAPPGKQTYMGTVQGRLELLGVNPSRISTQSARNFIQSLVREGIITQVERTR